MKISELKQIISNFPDDNDVEFVFYGNHFSLDSYVLYQNTVELTGMPMHDIPEINYTHVQSAITDNTVIPYKK